MNPYVFSLRIAYMYMIRNCIFFFIYVFNTTIIITIINIIKVNYNCHKNYPRTLWGNSLKSFRRLFAKSGRFHLISTSWKTPRWRPKWRPCLVTSHVSSSVTTHKGYVILSRTSKAKETVTKHLPQRNSNPDPQEWLDLEISVPIH